MTEIPREVYCLPYMEAFDKAIREMPPSDADLRQGVKDALCHYFAATVAYEQHGAKISKALYDPELFEQITDACEATIKLLLERHLAQGQPQEEAEE